MLVSINRNLQSWAKEVRLENQDCIHEVFDLADSKQQQQQSVKETSGLEQKIDME